MFLIPEIFNIYNSIDMFTYFRMVLYKIPFYYRHLKKNELYNIFPKINLKRCIDHSLLNKYKQQTT